MLITRAFVVSALAMLLLAGCSGKDDSPDLEVRQLSGSNGEITETLTDGGQTADEAFMADLSATLNLSFKIIHAMGEKDYSYLESVAAPGVTVNKEENRVYFERGGEQLSWDFLQPVTLDKLEYRFSTYVNEQQKEFLAGFAIYSGDSHSTVEIYFVKQGDVWLFNGLLTNA
ncbi:hypothetical protein C2I18_26260 [Paenibacillus sp. PK3_47]|uniref:hypothetical protein n=1 Tax=Paenibacillus sp. PK3_47 TaxID=2072642 RepID=UPI00201E6203|nr:hypothetical protein [Paenibacillus sp. PK3_47]UQZ36727.1 hypothetical protein C2I18_26260 [Paenibacillus sp. PK3_47]